MNLKTGSLLILDRVMIEGVNGYVDYLLGMKNFLYSPYPLLFTQKINRQQPHLLYIKKYRDCQENVVIFYFTVFNIFQG